MENVKKKYEGNLISLNFSLQSCASVAISINRDSLRTKGH